MNSDEKKLAETEKLQKVILGDLGKVRSKSPSMCRSPESSIGSQMKPVEGLDSGMYPGTATQHMLSCKQSSQAPHQVLSFQRGANWSPPLRICFTGLCHVVTRWNISSKPPDVRMGTTCTVILRDHSVLSARVFWNTHLVPLTSGDYVRGLGRKIKAFKMWFYLQLFLQLPGEWSGMGTEIRKDKCRIRNTNTQVSAVISY